MNCCNSVLSVGDLRDLMTAEQDDMEAVPQTDPELEQSQAMQHDNQAMQGTTATPPDAAFSAEAAAKYDAVMAFCLKRGQVLFTTLMTEFVQVPIGDLERLDATNAWLLHI